MPLTATLLALVQAATPAEPPDCAVYEGWLERYLAIDAFERKITLEPQAGTAWGRQWSEPTIREVAAESGGFYRVPSIEEALHWRNLYREAQSIAREELVLERPDLFALQSPFELSDDEYDERLRLIGQRTLSHLPAQTPVEVDIPSEIRASMREWSEQPPIECDWVRMANGTLNIGQTDDTISLSRAAFSDDGRFAVIYFAQRWGSFPGTGRFELLEDTEDGWTVIAHGPEWIR